jgi:peptide/nickel transport system ATP-binding protein
MRQNKSSLLKVSNLAVSFDTVDGPVQAVQGIDFDLNKGETLAIIGESGSGKSVTASVIMGILTCPPGRVKSGEILLDGEDILKLSDNKRRKLMGNKIAIIFQDTLSHLNPVFSVGKQISECFEVHNNFSRQESWNRAVELLDRVKIPNPSKRALDFPHQFSGGQRQRVMIAMALALEPDIIIADEPTTALDVTIQAKILELLADLRDERNMGLILITHDLGIAAEVADNVIVLKNGKIVERGPLKDVFVNPQHVYTKQLMSSIPGQSNNSKKIVINKKDNPILEIKNISKSYDTLACDNICFNLYSNEVLGVVGESGSGKTTISNLILRLTNPSNGTILYHGKNIFDFNKQELFNFRRKVQVVFQDPYASLNPTMNVYNIISEPWIIHSDFLEKKLFTNKISELLISVGLSPDDAKKYPHQFSGGQRQRIAIARALALNPEIIICDEAVSALDVSIQAQITKLLSDLREKLLLSYIFIAHDLPVIKDLADRVIVMKSGKLIEQGTVNEVFNNPKKQYTKDLLTASPSIQKIVNI